MSDLDPNVVTVSASGDLNALNAAALFIIEAALEDAALHAMDEVRELRASLTALGDDAPASYARTLEHGRAAAVRRAADYRDLADLFHRRLAETQREGD